MFYSLNVSVKSEMYFMLTHSSLIVREFDSIMHTMLGEWIEMCKIAI